MRKIKKLISMCLVMLLLVALVPSFNVQAATSMKLSKESLSLTVGKTNTLKVTTNKKASTVKWKTSNKKVVSISQNGKKVTLTAKKSGTVTITCQIGNKKQTCQVTVTEPVLKLNKTKATMKILTNLTLKVTTDKNASDVVWSTSNDKVVTIKQDGKKVTLTAKKSGTATITCQIGTEKETCKITVKKKSEVTSYTKDEVIAIVENTLRNIGLIKPEENYPKEILELTGPGGGLGWAECPISITNPYFNANEIVHDLQYDKSKNYKYYYIEYLRTENGKYVLRVYYG